MIERAETEGRKERKKESERKKKKRRTLLPPPSLPERTNVALFPPEDFSFSHHGSQQVDVEGEEAEAPWRVTARD